MALSADLNSISNESLAILKHEELIAINQDANGIQGVRVSPPQPEGAEVWAKQLTVASSGSGGGSSNASSLSVAVVFLNRASDGKARDISTTWEMLPGLKGVMIHAGHQVHVRDIWLRKDLEQPVGGAQGYVARNVRAHSVVVLKFTVVRPLPNE